MRPLSPPHLVLAEPGTTERDLCRLVARGLLVGCAAMRGDPGPYVAVDDVDVWVPRTVPWRDARRVAMETDCGDSWLSLRYVGKSDAELLGFTRDCQCDEVCEDRERDEYGYLTEDTATPCRVPTWHFRWVER